MIIVTGGAGFIGSNLVAKLEELNYSVAIIDWLGCDDKWRNIRKRSPIAIIEPENADVFCTKYAKNIEAVYHLGAVSDTTEINADKVMRNNFELSKTWWNKCIEWNVPFFYASSAATYGDGSEGFEDFDSFKKLKKLKPLNPYAFSKHLFDLWVAKQIEEVRITPLQWAGFKFFNVYGPNEFHKGSQRSVAIQLFETIKSGKPARLFKSTVNGLQDGGQSRDFVFVNDCVQVMIWFLLHAKTNGIFNIGTGSAKSFFKLATSVFNAMNLESFIEFFDMPETLRNKYQNFTQANISKLRNAGFNESFTSIENGVKQYVEVLLKDDCYI